MQRETNWRRRKLLCRNLCVFSRCLLQIEPRVSLLSSAFTRPERRRLKACQHLHFDSSEITADIDNQASQRQEDLKIECHNRAGRGMRQVAGRGFDGKEMFENALKKALETECTCRMFKTTELEAAVARGCLNCCATHIEEAKTYDNRKQDLSPLMEAAKNGQVEIAKLLLHHQTGFADRNGRTASDFARSANNQELWRLFPEDITEDEIAMLTKAHAAVCSCDGKSKNLAEAAENGCLRCCTSHTEQAGASEVAGQRRTAMMKAAEKGHLDIVRLLMYKEAKMHDARGWTALMLAASKGNADIVKLLIPSEGKMQNGEGKTALMAAAQNGHLPAVELLAPLEAGMQSRADFAALMHAAKEGRADVVGVLAPLEARMHRGDGITALMLAAQQGNADCVRLLLPHEAGMRAADDRTAAYYAVNYFQSDCAALLLENETETNEVPPQMLAAYRGDPRAMLQMRGTWMTPSWKDTTIVHFAFVGGRARCLRLLLREEEMQRLCAGKAFYFKHMAEGHRDALKCIIPALIRQSDELMINGFISIACSQKHTSTRALRPFCRISSNDTITKCNALLYAKETCAEFLKLVKGAGVIFASYVECDSGRQAFKLTSKTILEIGMKCGKELIRIISQSPIYSKQVALAKKQIEHARRVAELLDAHRDEEDNHPPVVSNDKQFSIRESGSEASFNRIILLASRDVSWKSISAQRRPRDQSTNSIKAKQGRNRLLIRNTVAYVKAQLRKIINE